MRVYEFIIHNIFIHNIRTWSKNSLRRSSWWWSVTTKRSSRITKRELIPSCWGLRNHGCLYLRQLRMGLGNYFLHYQMRHHHPTNNRLCQKPNPRSWNINLRIRSLMVSWDQRLWNRARTTGKHRMTRKWRTDSQKEISASIN